MIPLVYDQVNSWGKYDEFYLTLLKKINVKTIADLGCGCNILFSTTTKEYKQLAGSCI